LAKLTSDVRSKLGNASSLMCWPIPTGMPKVIEIFESAAERGKDRFRECFSRGRAVWHDADSFIAHIEIDPETYDVRANGELLVCEPVDKLPMAQRYFLF
jgi:hypothetical protein